MGNRSSCQAAVNLFTLLAVATACGLGFFILPSDAQASPYVVTQVDVAKPADVQLDRRQSAPAGAVVVSQKNRTFEPASVTIHAHHFITINNDDDTVHHAYCSTGDFKYNSGPQQLGTSVNIMFPKAGTYEVRCAIHPQMILVVNVTEAAN
jgi:plastocyanin